MKKKLYLAYGSNLNKRQMLHRCPTGQLVGTTELEDYRLTFRGGKESAVATVEPLKGSKVPCGIWEIGPIDEKHLDWYEGYPHLYRKEMVTVTLSGKQVEVMVYIMNEGRPENLPSKVYYEVIQEGYDDCRLDQEYLKSAVRQVKTTISA